MRDGKLQFSIGRLYMLCPTCHSQLEEGLPYCYASQCNFVDEINNYLSRQAYSHRFNESLLSHRLLIIDMLSSKGVILQLKHFLLLLPPDEFSFTFFNNPKLLFKQFPIGRYSSFSSKTRKDLYRILLNKFSDFMIYDSTKYNWRISWVMEDIKICIYSYDIFLRYAKLFIADCYSNISEEFYRHCIKQYPQNEILYQYYIEHLIHNNKYDLAIQFAEYSLNRFNEAKSKSYFYTLIVAVDILRPKRNELDFLALHYLNLLMKSGLWEKNVHASLYMKALEYYTPDEFKLGRGKDTSIIGNLYRGLVNTGKNLGKLFGGRDATIPHSEGILKAAPQLLQPSRIATFLQKHIEFDNDLSKLIERFNLTDATGTASVPIATHLYYLSLLNDDVLRSMTFSSAGHPHDVQHLKNLADHITNTSGNALEGHLNRIAGYTAEQHVAHSFLESGHIVSFPEFSNNPGYDLLVDGHPIQVKLTTNPELILEHFQKYPDIPVVTNAEMSQHFQHDPMVMIDPSMHYDQIHHQATNTLEGLEHHGDLGLVEIPLLSIAFSTIRNWRKWEGAAKFDEFGGIIATDAAYRSISGIVGAKVGGLIGTIVGPLGTVAGATLGGFIGTIAGGTGSSAKLDPLLCDCRDEIVYELKNFAVWFYAELMSPRVDYLQARYQHVVSWLKEQAELPYLHRFAYLLEVAAYESYSRAEGLKNFINNALAENTEVSVSHAGWAALNNIQYFYHPELQEKVSVLQNLLSKYKDIYSNKKGS